MIENKASLAFMEGPQGVGKTMATEFATTLGYKSVRGIPSGETLIKNTTSQNWYEGLEILEKITKEGIPYVSDRSFWSLVVFNMRKQPENAEFFYNLGSKMFRKRIDGVDHKVIVILASPQECVSRANPKSPVAIQTINESESEIKAYYELLGRLKDDGFKAFPIYNGGISRREFLKQIEVLLT